MSISLIRLRNLAVSFALVFALGCFSTAQAQSGRRVATPKSGPVAVATPEPTAATITSAEAPKAVVRFILGIDRYDSFSSVSPITLRGVRQNCARQLDDPEWVKVEVVEGAMLRSDAVNRAKAEKDSYVVWLRLRDDTMGSRQPGSQNNAYVEYTVFAPATAKIITSGSTYPQQRNRGVVQDSRIPGVEGDYYLNKAARDAADRILSKFRFRGRQP